MRATRVLLVAVVLFGAACTSGGDGEDKASPAATTTTTEPAPTVASVVRGVEARRIEATLRAIVGERATAEQRARTRETLRGELEAAGIEVREEPFGTGGVNLLGRIPPTQAGAGTVLLGAHYDTVPGSPGADDNGSGVAALVEVGRALAATTPDLAVELAFFDLEELGLLGSRHHVQARADKPVAAFNLDMVGYSCTEPGCQFVFPDIPDCMDVASVRDVGVGIGAVADEQSNGLLDEFVSTAAEHAADLEIGTARMAGHGQCLADTRRSDHAPLWDADVPTVFLTDTANFRNPNYHKGSDTLETIDIDLVAKVTRALTAAVATKAGIPEGG